MCKETGVRELCVQIQERVGRGCLFVCVCEGERLSERQRERQCDCVKQIDREKKRSWLG